MNEVVTAMCMTESLSIPSVLCSQCVPFQQGLQSTRAWTSAPGKLFREEVCARPPLPCAPSERNTKQASLMFCSLHAPFVQVVKQKDKAFCPGSRNRPLGQKAASILRSL